MSRVSGTTTSSRSRAPRIVVAILAVAVTVAGIAFVAWPTVEIDDAVTRENAAEIARLLEIQLDAELAVLR